MFTEEAQWDVNENSDSRDINEIPEERNEGDKGHLLVSRVCLALVVAEELWLRTNIFQSTCTIKGKVCQFFIDSGSSRNVVSDEACRKLGLLREDHPTPYKLTWLKEGTKIRVTQRALVALSIGTHYKDKIFCDVIQIDLGHLLLGRPWQNDREVVHNGKTNVYSFIFDNRRIVLLPTQTIPRDSGSMPCTTTTPTSRGMGVLFCSLFAFKTELQKIGFALFLLASNSSPTLAPAMAPWIS